MKKLIVGFILLVCGFAYGINQTLPSNGVIAYLQSSPAHTYYAASAAFTPAATPSDVCTISGSAGKLTKVYSIRLSQEQTTAGINQWFLIKRSTLDTAGTATTLTGVPADTNELAPASIAKNWTANPTPGTAVGTLRDVFIPSQIPASGSTAYYEFSFQPTQGGKAIYLRTANESLALNFGGAALPTGLSVICEFVWTEENF